MHVLNKFKYCPQCGSKSIFFDKKHFVCGNCNFDFYINSSGAVAGLIIDENGSLLLTRRKFDPCKGTLDLPGGFIDINEKAEDALVREIKEELNLEIIELNFFGSFPNTYTFKEIDYYTVDLTFECKVKTFATLQANDDVSEVEFIPLKKIDTTEIGLSSIKTIVSTYIEKS
ncbi:NUDIX domain-containing protein [Flammeovirga pectinis]|uniref:NUDIX domain-containing protein n=1 Tax=Flammeovirga pectinis TaxID=2494373 RepID=A0A3S9P1U8_9BACT|nr:NUDIX domain-containing protein [Flammeovirga pectinis]AZQ62158.1 NUDIX domain-containing protein [Flammeovirga pectinis]